MYLKGLSWQDISESLSIHGCGVRKSRIQENVPGDVTCEKGETRKGRVGKEEKNGFCSGLVAFDILVEFKCKSSQNSK